MVESPKDALFCAQILLVCAIRRGDLKHYFERCWGLLSSMVKRMEMLSELEVIQLSNFMFFCLGFSEQDGEAAFQANFSKLCAAANEFLQVELPALDPADAFKLHAALSEQFAQTICQIVQSPHNNVFLKNIITFLSKVKNIFPNNRTDYAMIQSTFNEVIRSQGFPSELKEGLKRYELIIKEKFKDPAAENNDSPSEDVKRLARNEEKRPDVEEEEALRKRSKADSAKAERRPDYRGRPDNYNSSKRVKRQ